MALTIDELVALCYRLKDVRTKDLKSFSSEVGIHWKALHTLKLLLGYKVREKPIVSTEKAQEIERMNAEGKSCYEIAAVVGMSPSSVYYYCGRHNLEYRKNADWTEMKIRTLIDMTIKGFSDKDIAARVGIPLMAVRSQRHRLNHKQRCAKWIPVAEKVGYYRWLESRKGKEAA